MKKLVPAAIKLSIKLLLQSGKDIVSGNSKNFAGKYSADTGLIKLFAIEQQIKQTGSTANKIHNISLAIKKVNNLVIFPGEIFSFWHIVGNPSAKKHYKKSRSIVAGKIIADTGGGLCQLSGLVYYSALKAGLTILERHAHSMDIYTDEERFTPLGSDATVAYGYKDLRLKNNLHLPVQFRFIITGSSLSISVYSAENIPVNQISFSNTKHPGYTEVLTYSNSNLLCKNIYRLAMGT